MAAPRNRKHIIVPTGPTVEGYKPHDRKFTIRKPPEPSSRPRHAAVLRRALESAIEDTQQRRTQLDDESQPPVPGVYLEVESIPGWDLAISGLEHTVKDPRKRIEVLAVKVAPSLIDASPAAQPTQRATVFVPEGQIKHFIGRLEKYALETPKKARERRYEDLFDRVAALRPATIRALWTDPDESYPSSGKVIWWEVWLRRHDGSEFERAMEFAARHDLQVAPRRLEFDDRIVTLIRANSDQLALSLDVLNDIAELRLAKETATVFADMAADQQASWADDLHQRVRQAPDTAPTVCVLDTGVTHGHPLLRGALHAADCHACDPAWGTHDHHGHGTEMAGLALLGDLTPLLEHSAIVELRHRLESVKILPPKGTTQPELYGAIVGEAVGRVEIQASERRRCFSMSVTATDQRERGQPTSWSAAIDALASGRMFDVSRQGLVFMDDGRDPTRRLFVLSAGNIAEDALQVQHLDRSDADPIHDPAQAWNALTVGAFTDKAQIKDSRWSEYRPVANRGDLSPWSTTGVSFAEPWPIKPDVVLEGGNVVRSLKGDVDFPCPDLCLLSTHYRPQDRLFTLSWATSAATAQAARIAATIAAEYPALWPEAVRALIVHSAEWTPQMLNHLRGASGKRARGRLVRRYGFGVPDLSRALRSATDALTLIAQNIIRPFAQGKMREIHFFELPWPRETLQGLGETAVRLRITLSYFVEPNPGRRGWRKRYQYPSHGLRFDLKSPTESIDEFRKRLNKRALDEAEEKPHTGQDSTEWYLGEQNRNRGSIHSDILQGFAADLAERGVIAVYPVSGWWKDQPKRDRSDKGARYALVMSIETPGVETDIWTPVAQSVGVPIAVEAQ